MLTAAEVSAKLGLSQRKVYDLAGAGLLPRYRFGAAIRFDPADVEAYRASCPDLQSTHAPYAHHAT